MDSGSTDFRQTEPEAPAGVFPGESAWHDPEPALAYLHEHWNVSLFDVRSRRRRFAWCMTLYKKLLGFLLRPYLNLILFRQAELNRRAAILLSQVWSRTQRLEADALHRGNAQRIAQLEQQLGELRVRLEQLDHESREALGKLAPGLEASLAAVVREMGREVAGLRTETEAFHESMQASIDRQLSLLSRSLLEDAGSLGEEEWEEEWEEGLPESLTREPGEI